MTVVTRGVLMVRRYTHSATIWLASQLARESQRRKRGRSGRGGKPARRPARWSGMRRSGEGGEFRRWVAVCRRALVRRPGEFGRERRGLGK